MIKVQTNKSQKILKLRSENLNLILNQLKGKSELNTLLLGLYILCFFT